MKFYNRIAFKVSFFVFVLIIISVMLLLGSMMRTYEKNLDQQVIVIALCLIHMFIVFISIIILIKTFNKPSNEEEKAILINQLYTDSLTSMKNRNAILVKLKEILGVKDKNLYVWIFDIHNFRYINGSFGYDVGNELLRSVGNILFNLDMECYDIARLDSDRFCIIFDDEVNVEHVSSLLNKKLSQVTYKDCRYTLSGCSGIAKGSYGDEAEDIIRNAEIALLQAKESGLKGYAFYDDSYSIKLNERLRIMNYLKRSLARNEIFIVYQPIVDALKCKIIGYESLARWKSTEYGLVPPNIFIEMAESIGFIMELGAYICEEAIRFACKVNVMNEGCIVSINISPIQLKETNFKLMFLNLLKKYDLDPKFIAIEITEGVYIENINGARKVLQDLRDIGIKVYLDDFGTGYSSLSYLENLPIDALKIDKSFVDKLEEEHSSKMMSVFKSLTDSLEMEIIAEGVESQQQLDILVNHGFKYIQGYYYSKPLVEEEVLMLNTSLSFNYRCI